MESNAASTSDFTLESAGLIATAPAALDTVCDPPLHEPLATPTELKGDLANPDLDTGHVNSEDSLQTSILWLLGLAVAQKSIGFVRSIVVCRLLDPMNLGTWGMALALMDTLLPLCLLSIPGCFGRYVEHFRQRDQLRAFLRQASLICMATLATSATMLCCFREQISTICFGSPSYSGTLLLAATAMVPSAIFGFCGELLVALRLGKTSTIGTFCRGVSFTALTIGLLLFWRNDATSMIVACGVSYVLSLALVVPAVVRAIRSQRPDAKPLPVIRTWSGLTRFLLAFWLTDFLTNMFFTVDRYMLVNFGKGDAAFVLSQVGNYESAHVIPILIASVTLMVGRLILPYQVREWELGEHERVWNGTCLGIKAMSLVLFVGGWVCVVVSRPVFDMWFRGQYESGLAIVPIAVAIYSFAGLASMWMNYFLCIERAFLGTVTTFCAVMVNVVGNYLLVPRLGLLGAALATLMANCILIGLSIFVGHRHGLRARWETTALAFLPLAVCIPPWAAAAVWVAVLALMSSGFLINRKEWQTVRRLWDDLTSRLGSALGAQR